MDIYVVKAGDTLTSIADSFGVSRESIIDANEIAYPDRLVVGLALVIPTPNTDEKLGSFITNGYVYPNVNLEILERTLPNLTYLTIFSYGITPEGGIVPIEDENVLSLTNQYGVVPVMLLSTITAEGRFSSENASQLLSNPEAQTILIERITNTMQAKGYRALDVDFEYIPPYNKNDYVEFIRRLTSALNPLDYEVFVALAPKESATQRGLLYEAHDYRQLGEVANRVLLMTYEWGYTFGPPWAVAPLNKVNDVVRYAVTEIPPEKILLGIPNYGYDWNLPYIPGTSARSLGNVEAMNLALQYGSEIFFDTLAQAPFFYYTSDDGQQHAVWFEDAQSIRAKLELANSYNLSGVSFWNLMRYFPQNWAVLNNYYNIERI